MNPGSEDTAGRSPASRPRGWPGRLLKGTVAAVLGLVAALAVAELGLWLFYVLQARSPIGAQGTGQGAALVCLGDSWTYGMASGDPARFSFPARLREGLDARLGKGRIEVVNEGEPGATSMFVLRKVGAWVERGRPLIAVVLVGGGNWFGIDLVQPAGQGDLPFRPPERPLLMHLRTYRLLRLFTQLPHLAPIRSRLTASPALGHAYLEDLFNTLEARLRAQDSTDERGYTPPLSGVGCGSDVEAELLAGEVRRLQGRPTDEIERVLARKPRCLAALVTALELSVQGGFSSFTRSLIRRVLTLDPSQPQALLLQALDDNERIPGGDPRFLPRLNAVISHSPRYLKAWRHLILASARLDPGMCGARDHLEAVQRICPSCRWTQDLLSLIRERVDKPASEALWADLGAMHLLIRKHGARLLLLEYPQNGTTCRRVITGQIADFAEANQVPLLDLDEVIGFCTPEGIARDSKARATCTPGGHPNAEGYRRIAVLVMKKLESLGWIRKDE